MSSKPQQKPFKIRRSPPEVFYNKAILKILVKLIGEHLCQILLFHKVTGSEAVTWRCSLKKVFFKTQQKSQKNICAGDLSCKPQVCNLFKKETLAQVFSCKFWEIFKSTFLQTTFHGYFYKLGPLCAWLCPYCSTYCAIFKYQCIC